MIWEYNPVRCNANLTNEVYEMNKNKTRRLLSFVIIAVCLISLVACSGNYTDPHGTYPTDETKYKPTLNFSSKSRETIYYMVEEAFSSSVAKDCLSSLNATGLADILTEITIDENNVIHATTEDKYALDVTIQFDDLWDVQIYISQIPPQAILTTASYIKFNKEGEHYTACICDNWTEGVYDTNNGTITDEIGKDLIITFDEDVQNSSTNISQPGVIKSNPLIVSVDEFVQDINADIAAAKEKYNGKYIKITGDVKQIVDGGIMTGYYIYGNRGDSGLRIVCWQDGDPQKGVAEGKTYTFLGKIREVTTANATEIAECIILTN